MKNLTVILGLFLTITLSSCSDDDQDTSSNSLVGTAWFGTDDDEGEVYTFSSATNFTFSGDGSTQNGTYTFNGSTGVLSHTDGDFDFSVVGNVMTVENGVNGSANSVYVKQ